MDDIVDRLYCSYANPPCEQCTFCAAKAEIERLRAENAAMRRQALQNMIQHSENADIYEKQRTLQRAIYNILATDPTPMATLKDTLKE